MPSSNSEHIDRRRFVKRSGKALMGAALASYGSTGLANLATNRLDGGAVSRSPSGARRKITREMVDNSPYIESWKAISEHARGLMDGQNPLAQSLEGFLTTHDFTVKNVGHYAYTLPGSTIEDLQTACAFMARPVSEGGLGEGPFVVIDSNESTAYTHYNPLIGEGPDALRACSKPQLSQVIDIDGVPTTVRRPAAEAGYTPSTYDVVTALCKFSDSWYFELNIQLDNTPSLYRDEASRIELLELQRDIWGSIIPEDLEPLRGSERLFTDLPFFHHFAIISKINFGPDIRQSPFRRDYLKALEIGNPVGELHSTEGIPYFETVLDRMPGYRHAVPTLFEILPTPDILNRLIDYTREINLEKGELAGEALLNWVNERATTDDRFGDNIIVSADSITGLIRWMLARERNQ